jgi:hypothetical protein
MRAMKAKRKSIFESRRFMTIVWILVLGGSLALQEWPSHSISYAFSAYRQWLVEGTWWVNTMDGLHIVFIQQLGWIVAVLAFLAWFVWMAKRELGKEERKWRQRQERLERKAARERGG